MQTLRKEALQETKRLVLIGQRECSQTDDITELLCVPGSWPARPAWRRWAAETPEHHWWEPSRSHSPCAAGWEERTSSSCSPSHTLERERERERETHRERERVRETQREREREREYYMDSDGTRLQQSTSQVDSVHRHHIGHRSSYNNILLLFFTVLEWPTVGIYLLATYLIGKLIRMSEW